MIAIDSSVLSSMLDQIEARDVMIARDAVESGSAILPPVVLAEVLSRPGLSDEAIRVMLSLPLLSIRDGYWSRVGFLRADLVSRRLKAGLADCLVAQSCIDHDIPLIAHDRDFRHFVSAGLTLL